jgi:DNA-binding GntR family transcriptional regulator
MELSASAVPSRMARRLKVISGPPALFVLRRYLNPAGEAFEITLSVHPWQRYRYSFEVQRSSARARQATIESLTKVIP